MTAGALPEYLHTLAFRLGRVDELAADIAAATLEFISADPVVINERRTAGRAELFVESIASVPPILSLLFSDAINQLRSALDNAVVLLIERDRGEPLRGPALMAAKFIIGSNEARYLDAVTRVGRHVPELTAEHPIGLAMADLQPFAMGEVGRAMKRHSSPAAPRDHHLRVLQAYSNEDKHHRLRLTVMGNVQSKSMTGRAKVTPGSHDLAVGQVVSSIRIGTPDIIEVHPFIALRRPDSGILVPPGAELNELHRWVAEVGLPRLCEISEGMSFAPGVDVRTNGLSELERIAIADAVYAHEHGGAAFTAAFMDRVRAGGDDVRLPRFYQQWLRSD